MLDSEPNEDNTASPVVVQNENVDETPVEYTPELESPDEVPVVEETPAAPVMSDPNAKMSDDDIAALIASMGGDSAPAEEIPVEEETPAAEETPAE